MPADQARILRGLIERYPPHEGPPTRTSAHGEVLRLVERLEAGGVATVTPQITSEVVLRALTDAENLTSSSGPTSAVDRVHTVLHGYLQAVCDGIGITYQREESMVALLRKLRAGHPKLQDLGPRADDVAKILNACGAILDALLPVRNRASVAHPNRELPGEPEARLVINTGRTILHYLDDKLS